MNEQNKTGTPPDSSTSPEKIWIHRVRDSLGVILSITILCAALWFLHRELDNLKPDAISEQIRAIPIWDLLAAIGCAAAGYLVLTGYETAAVRYVGRKLPYRQVAQTAFMAYAVGHNVGVAALSGGSIRYRMYSLQGLSAMEIAKIIVFSTVTFFLGMSLLLGFAFLLMPGHETVVLNVPAGLLDAAGMLLLSVPIAYLLSVFIRRQPLVVRSWEFSLPGRDIGVAQIALSVADLSFAAGTLYVLLSPDLAMNFFQFLGIFLIAIAAGLISSVPGGIGVFEAVLLAALPQVDRGVLLGTVIVYRLIYYVAPLTLAMALLISHEVRHHARTLIAPTREVAKRLSSIAPQLVAVAVFLAGTVLLLSGSTPAISSRLNFIAKAIPLPVLELSHLAGSMLGVGMLILAQGLHRRLRGAYMVAVVLLVAGILISLLKGLDYEEALILSGILVLVRVSKNEFYRSASLANERFTPAWIGSIVLVLCIVAWVGLVSFRDVRYSDQLWWQFALHADAPRMLRASFAAAITALGFYLYRLLRTLFAKPLLEASEIDMEAVRQVIATTGNPSANVALLGDKHFHWSTDRRAFIMYAVSGNSWVALGDPVGPEESHTDLAWSFREMVDRHDGRTVFYEISDHSLSVYVDMGLALAKLGEDARVSLTDFTLQGSERAEFRQAQNRARREGAVFEVIPRENVPAIVGELTSVSNDWLKDKATAEKGFSLGAYSEDYVANFDCAVVRVNNSVVAFANLWPAPAVGELSIDLMRFNQQAPKGVMDFLFTELMLWGKEQGYSWFSLGMVPLSGLEQRTLAPLWHKLGHLIFQHGEAFYNFEGLRHYKEKFKPQWRPRYIACPDGMLGLPRALLDTARLISGGVTKIVSK
jgi:phosphatidylglycerol lysyltransferase